MYIGNRDYFLTYVLQTSAEDLAAALADANQAYHTFQIPKSGGTRTIQAIRRESPLYRLQKNLCRNFLDKISLPVPAAGFVKEESYLTFLKPHTGKAYYLRLDIQGFFDSITTDMLRASFSEFFSDDAPENLEDFLALCTFGGRLPQGAVTSPAVSNVVFRRADQRILKYCQSFDVLYRSGQRLAEDVCYTRYADDLLFSSRHLDFSSAPYFMGMVSGILRDCGFRLNREKVKLGRGEISLSGFVVSANIHLSRKKLYPLNRLLHVLSKTDVYGSKTYRVRKAFFRQENWLDEINKMEIPGGRGTLRFRTPQDFLNYLCGYRSFILSILKANDAADKDMRQLSKKVQKVESIIDCVLNAAGEGAG